MEHDCDTGFVDHSSLHSVDLGMHHLETIVEIEIMSVSMLFIVARYFNRKKKFRWNIFTMLYRLSDL